MSDAEQKRVFSSKGSSHGPKETLPHVGKPLDGSQYHTVIEEQIYSELPPTSQEQQPIRARHLAEVVTEEEDSKAREQGSLPSPPVCRVENTPR